VAAGAIRGKSLLRCGRNRGALLRSGPVSILTKDARPAKKRRSKCQGQGSRKKVCLPNDQSTFPRVSFNALSHKKKEEDLNQAKN